MLIQRVVPLVALALVMSPGARAETCAVDTIRSAIETGFRDAPHAIVTDSGRTYLVPRGTRFAAGDWQDGDALKICTNPFFPAGSRMISMTNVRRGSDSTIQAALAERAPIPSTSAP